MRCRTRSCIFRPAVFLCCLLIGTMSARAAGRDPAAGIPNDAELESAAATIGTITIVRDNVFDLSQPGEDYRLYALANRLHVRTQDAVIRAQILIEPGDRFSRRLLEESERLLRRNRYLFDASIQVASYADGVVDIEVRTRDVWTLVPDVSFSRTGGEDKWRVGIIENNLLGRGTRLRFAYEENVDRDVTLFEVVDTNLFRTRADLLMQVADSSDGDASRFRLQRPFFSLDSRWSAGVDLSTRRVENRFFELGNEAAEYREDAEFYSLFGGLSGGLQNGWVRRWTAGLVFDDRQFSSVQDPRFPELLPENRRFVYPFIGLEILEDNFQTAENRQQFERTEDFLLGARFSASLGYASESLDSDRNALLYRASASRGFGSLRSTALLIGGAVSGRIDDGNAANTLLSANARYFRQQNNNWLFFATLRGAWGSRLNLDNLPVLEAAADCADTRCVTRAAARHCFSPLKNAISPSGIRSGCFVSVSPHLRIPAEPGVVMHLATNHSAG